MKMKSKKMVHEDAAQDKKLIKKELKKDMAKMVKKKGCK